MKSYAHLQPGVGRGRRQVRILFTCAGRRIELMQAFRKAARSLGVAAELHATDTDPFFAAGCFADRAHQVPRADSSGYVNSLLKVVERYKIDLLVPLLDVELLALAKARGRFDRIGCGVLISSPKVVEICRNKINTYEFLKDHGIDTPCTWRLDEVLSFKKQQFPYFLKPVAGSASKGNYIIRNRQELGSPLLKVDDPIVQEFVDGTEYTLDVYTGFDGVPRSVVPRRRLEVRGGEVTTACTYKHERIMETGLRVAAALKECVGLVTVQLIHAPDERIKVIEINPRFGGGVPLGIRAGANFPKWLLAEWLGHRPRIRLGDFRDGLIMLRYHQAYFVDGKKPVGIPVQNNTTKRRKK